MEDMVVMEVLEASVALEVSGVMGVMEVSVLDTVRHYKKYPPTAKKSYANTELSCA